MCGSKSWGIIWHRVLPLLMCHSARGSPALLSRGPAVTAPRPKITPANGGEERQGSQSIEVINDIACFLFGQLIVCFLSPNPKHHTEAKHFLEFCIFSLLLSVYFHFPLFEIQRDPMCGSLLQTVSYLYFFFIVCAKVLLSHEFCR